MKQLMIPFQSQFLLYSFLFIILGGCMIKSPFLVNSGMFHYFAFSIGTGVLTLFFIIQSGFRDFKIAFSFPLSLFVIWGTYIAIHTLNIGSKEWYQGGYLILSCVYVIAMCHLVKRKQSIAEQILLLFGLSGLVQAFVCILQYVEILPPCNATFSISGTLDNPNITAMYIVAVIPVFLFSSTQRKLKLLILVPLLLALLTLNCRTAFLGCLIILLIYLYFNERFLSIIKCSSCGGIKSASSQPKKKAKTRSNCGVCSCSGVAWWEEGHNKIIDKYLTDNFTSVQLTNIKQGSKNADGSKYQTTEFAYMHAMRTPGESVEQTIGHMRKHFTDEVEKYLNNNDYIALGMALHPIMDAYSPRHEFETWEGRFIDYVPHSTESIHLYPGRAEQASKAIDAICNALQPETDIGFIFDQWIDMYKNTYEQ